MLSKQPLSTYKEPCMRKTSESLESTWLSASDFGECYVRPSDDQSYPCLTLVYNGKDLRIKPDIVHASLSAISVKHYYGKCVNDEEEINFDEIDDFISDQPEETYGYEIFGVEQQTPSLLSNFSWKDSDYKYSASDSQLAKGEAASESFLPICTRQNINYRNSFWNLHRPELCKLTWPQKYVSTATVTEHLHNHLAVHGAICAEFHTEEDRQNALNEELSEYGRLKILAFPRELPPDEKTFPLNKNNLSKLLLNDMKCKGFSHWKSQIVSEERCLELSDDEDVHETGKKVHRSKEEFCLTIGRHIRKPPILKTEFEAEEESPEAEPFLYPEDEENGFFFFDWLQIQAEESFGEAATEESTTVDLEPVPIPLVEPCPILAMDDFCRAVAKSDFSDLRCNPDDF